MLRTTLEMIRFSDEMKYLRKIEDRETRPRDRSLRGKARRNARKAKNKEKANG